MGGEFCSQVVSSSEVYRMYGQYTGRGANSLSIIGRLSTLWSVHFKGSTVLSYMLIPFFIVMATN